MNHLRLSSLFVFTVCALVVVTMALPVYRAYAPAIKAPSARPPMEISPNQPAPQEEECRARLLAVANEINEYRARHGHLPWNIRNLATPRTCPLTGRKYVYVPGEWGDEAVDYAPPELKREFRSMVDGIRWDVLAVVWCPSHFDPSTVTGITWAPNFEYYVPGGTADNPVRFLGVNLLPEVGYFDKWGPHADMISDWFRTNNIRIWIEGRRRR
jgi:hypothetical protein